MENVKRLPYICQNTQQIQMYGSLLCAFFHLCLVSVLPSGPSLLEMSFCRNLFPTFYSSLGDFEPTSKQTLSRDSLCYSPPNMISHCRGMILLLATNVFCAPDGHLVLETNALKAHISTSAAHSNSYMQLPVTSKCNLSRDDCYSQVATHMSP